MEKIELSGLSGLFTCVAKVMTAHADELCEMDAKMGDGDLGLTMKKGFAALPQLIEEIDEPDIGIRLMKAGMKMASVVPSTMGTLMASGVLTGGKALKGKTTLDAAGFAAYLDGFSAGIMKRGKCEPGDRTVLDAIAPAAQAALGCLSENPGATLASVCEAAVIGAQKGVESTREMLPRQTFCS